jgi:acyl carrier protein
MARCIEDTTTLSTAKLGQDYSLQIPHIQARGGSLPSTPQARPRLSSHHTQTSPQSATASLFNPTSNNSHTVAGLVKHHGITQVLQNKGPLFSVLLRDNANAFGGDAVSRPADGSTVSAKASLGETASFEEATEVEAAVVGKLASMITAPPEDLTMETSIGDLGIDSLVAVELRNWLAKELEATSPVLTIVSTASASLPVGLVMPKSSLVVGKYGLANGDVPKQAACFYM